MSIWLTNNIIMQSVVTFICLLQVGAICLQYSHDDPKKFVLGYCIVAAPYPTRIIGVQITYRIATQAIWPRLNQLRIFFLQ